MHFSALLADDGAVSPVIGVVLMVAITVILAAVIGTFVLGVAEGIQETTPNAQFGHAYDDAGDNATITHRAGDAIPADRLNVSVSGVGQSAWYRGDTSTDAGETVRAGRSFETGETETLSGNVTAGDTVRVIWHAADGDRTTTLLTREIR